MHALMQPRNSLHERRLLVVDSDPGARDALVQLLQREGAQVHAFPHGPAAVAWCASRPRAQVDAVIIDLTLPFMSGSDTLAALRAALRNEALQALALTASLDPEQADADPSGRRLGFDALLLKPAACQDLLAWLEQLTARAQLSSHARRQRISQLLLSALQQISPSTPKRPPSATQRGFTCRPVPTPPPWQLPHRRTPWCVGWCIEALRDLATTTTKHC